MRPRLAACPSRASAGLCRDLLRADNAGLQHGSDLSQNRRLSRFQAASVVTVPRSRFRLSCLLACASLLSACDTLPTSGPTAAQVRRQATQPTTAAPAVKVIDVDGQVARRLLDRGRRQLFSEAFGAARPKVATLGPGDIVELSIWEAPPATLFGGGSTGGRDASSLRSGVSGTHAAVLPEQMVDADGFINVPFVGRIEAAGRTPAAVESAIAAKLRGKAHEPEAILRVLRNASSTVTVVGEVATSTRLPITAAGERLLDALAVTGGVRQPVHKMTLQLTRGELTASLPLDQVIRDPRQNVPLQGGDVVTALFQPLSFTALGSTGRNEEVNFEAQGITLAQALARVGGLNDARSDARGVFLFRFEDPAVAAGGEAAGSASASTVAWQTKVPVVYRVDLTDANSFFVMQNFAVNDKDILYVSNAPVAELQKFLNTVFSIAYPVANVIQVTR